MGVAWSGGELVAEHRQAAHGFAPGRFVLKDVPVLGELAVFEANDVGCNPRCGPADPTEAAMRDDIITVGHYQMVLVARGVRQRANQVEQAVASRRNMGAMLNVAV